jgi:flagellar basal body-associated protein FliL
MEDKDYLEAITVMSNTVNQLAIEKDAKNRKKSTIIVALIIVLFLNTCMFVACIAYFVHNVYNYQYVNTNVNNNVNTNMEGR